MRLNFHAFLYTATIVVLSACSGVSTDSASKQEGAAGAPASHAATTAPANQDAAVQPANSPSKAEPAVDFRMPDFRGVNLQDAQNQVQELGIFYSKSHDLRGSRSQVVDSNWQVCTQSPAVGAEVKGNAADYEGVLDFGVVKLTETCP